MSDCPRCHGSGWYHPDFAQPRELIRCHHHGARPGPRCCLDGLCGLDPYHAGECSALDETGRFYPRALAAYERSHGE